MEQSGPSQHHREAAPAQRSETQPTEEAQPPVGRPSVEQIADRVYELLREDVRIARERRR